jgi:hypothetical protein
MKKIFILCMATTFGYLQAGGAPLGLEPLSIGVKDPDTKSITSRFSYVGIACGEECDNCVQKVTCNGCGCACCNNDSCCKVICFQPKGQEYQDLEFLDRS